MKFNLMNVDIVDLVQLICFVVIVYLFLSKFRTLSPIYATGALTVIYLFIQYVIPLIFNKNQVVSQVFCPSNNSNTDQNNSLKKEIEILEKI